MTEAHSTEERPRDIASVIARLRFGDSDGDDHDIAANEIERLEREVNRLLGLMSEHDTRESFRCLECGAYHLRQPLDVPVTRDTRPCRVDYCPNDAQDGSDACGQHDPR